MRDRLVHKNLSLVISAAMLLCFAAHFFGQRLPDANPEDVGMSTERLALIDGIVKESIKKKETPGAVVLVGRHGKVVYRKAFGNRSLVPSVEKMTVDTVFDLASLTKPLATATAIMILVEQGKVRIKDTVDKFIPEIQAVNAKAVTIEQLLTHTSGYAPDFDLGEKWFGRAGMIRALKKEPLKHIPGKNFVYSDIGFIILGEIVHRVSGMPLDEFVAKQQFSALENTRFLTRKRNRVSEPFDSPVAPTERYCNQQGYLGGKATLQCDQSIVLRGAVHDPTAFRMNGVAGHAGLFSTADDLAVICEMFLNGGMINNQRVLSPIAVEVMTKPRMVGAGGTRGLGWDIDTRFSSNLGELFPAGTFGHTGFTGPSITLDPQNSVFVVFLANRVHPDGKGNVVSLRGRIATLVAGAITNAEMIRKPKVVPKVVLNGIDVLEKWDFMPLNDLHVGLVTNQTGRSLDGRSTIDVLNKSPRVNLQALFSPEHGIRGELDQAAIGDSKDKKTGLPIYSLYGKTRRPTSGQLRGIDAIVFDIQDIGTRYYTYVATLRYVLEEAAANHVRVFVLDRPNPINGIDVEGPLADVDKLSFVAPHTIPIRHGMTVGEIATMMNEQQGIRAKLEVIKMKNWRRGSYFDETGQQWVNPSPNMRSLTQALLYPGIGLLETTNLSVGRGTDTPFEVIGAPWIKSRELAAGLNGLRLAGVRFVPVAFTPKSSVFKGQKCWGVNIIVTDRSRFRPVQTGLKIAWYLRSKYREEWQIGNYPTLLVNDSVLKDLVAGKNIESVLMGIDKDVEAFKKRRDKFLLY